jgi:hypothetical protein
MWIRILLLFAVGIGLNWVVSEEIKRHHKHQVSHQEMFDEKSQIYLHHEKNHDIVAANRTKSHRA